MKFFGKKTHSTRAGSLFDWTCLLLGILSFCGVSYTTIRNIVHSSWNTHWRTVVFWGIILITCVVVYHIFRYFSSTIIRKTINLFTYKSRYKYLVWENTYEYLSEDVMQFRSELTVKPLETGVEYIRTRYNWSGSTAIIPMPITDNGFMTGAIVCDGKEFGYHFYRVYCSTMINWNDPPVKLGVQILNMRDVDRTAAPHLLTNINVDTDLLILKVILPSNIHYRNLEYLEYLHATDDHHWHRYDSGSDNTPVSVDHTTDGNNKTIITWRVKKPIFGGKYVIKWEPI